MKAALALSLKHLQMKQEIWQPLRTQPELETLPYNSLVTTCPLSGTRLLFCILWGLTLFWL